MGIFQGLAGNLSELSKEDVEKSYGQYLLDTEEIKSGYKLIRDAIVITNHRVLIFDKQGATGKKMRADSIYLNSIFEVSCETAGAGIDDSELTISFIKSPYHRANNITVSEKKLEFPKKFDIIPLYQYFEAKAHENLKRLNG
ncbi:MAG: PH domain-containing protein [Vallitalea sp.]|jgi:hypothetical protein|nr:PH domain-containing protein [Vallitalea sp.]